MIICTSDISEKFRPLPFREFKIKFENYHNSNTTVVGFDMNRVKKKLRKRLFTDILSVYVDMC